MREILMENYGYLFEDDLIDEMVDFGRFKKVKAGEVLIDYNDKVSYMPLLLQGAVKIMRLDADGDELLLYFIERGDTCSMTLTCCLGETRSQIKAVAETDAQMIQIPISKMKDWMKKYDGWMEFVFNSYHTRTNEMLEAVDTLAFMDMHSRLFKYLRDKVLVNKTKELEITHQDIAYDLHTSRVVISRLLKRLEKEGKIKLSRNKLTVLQL
jgi:CRP/FNR family transcriptional regulator